MYEFCTIYYCYYFHFISFHFFFDTFAFALPGSNFLSIPLYFLDKKISEKKKLREIDKRTHKEIKGGNKLN